ncbi:MAG: hypothetical protein ACLQU2_13560 [Candidatus Binataceae bacterium]
MNTTLAERGLEGPDRAAMVRDGDWYEKFYPMPRDPQKSSFFRRARHAKGAKSGIGVGTLVALSRPPELLSRHHQTGRALRGASSSVGRFEGRQCVNRLILRGACPRLVISNRPPRL